MLDREDKLTDEPRRVSDSVLHKLAAITVDARRGNVEAVAIVTVSPDGEPRCHFAGEGDLVASINLGVDMLKAALMGRALKVSPHSGLIVPGAN